MTVIVVDTAGVRADVNPLDFRSWVGQGGFLWPDLVGAERSDATAWLDVLGLDPANVVWAMRFGQTGRMLIGGQRRSRSMRPILAVADVCHN